MGSLTRTRLATSLLAVVLIATSSAGCSASFSIGGDTVDKADIAKEAKAKLDPVFEARGRPTLPPITCPSDMDLKAGETTRCYAKGSFGDGLEGTIGITVTIRSVDGSTANLHFETDENVKK